MARRATSATAIQNSERSDMAPTVRASNAPPVAMCTAKARKTRTVDTARNKASGAAQRLASSSADPART
jgi:hypothetical protein